MPLYLALALKLGSAGGGAQEFGATDVLLLETASDKLLLEGGTDAILLEGFV